MSFQLNSREINGVVVVDVVGRLTIGDGRTQLRDLIYVFSGEGHKKFVLNLAGVEFVDSNGVGELARCYSTLRQRGGEMKLAGVRKNVNDLLHLTRMNTLFEIFTEEHSAIKAF